MHTVCFFVILPRQAHNIFFYLLMKRVHSILHYIDRSNVVGRHASSLAITRCLMEKGLLKYCMFPYVLYRYCKLYLQPA